MQYPRNLCKLLCRSTRPLQFDLRMYRKETISSTEKHPVSSHAEVKHPPPFEPNRMPIYEYRLVPQAELAS